jgi:type IV pilus assembly protein PilM
MIVARYIGLSLCEQGLRAVAVGKRRRQTQILGWEDRPWPSACLNPGFRKFNVIEEEPFVATVRETLESLGVKKGRVALSLSDAVGKVLITTLGEPLKRGREGINLLKWQVREQLPLDPEEIRLACQVVGTEPEGKTRVLVAAVSNEVLKQYENLLAEAGLVPAVVLFESLNLMHFYHADGIPVRDHLLIVWTSATLTLQLFCDGLLQASRSRPAPAGEKALFQEISRTLADWERTWPEANTAPVYLHGTSGAVIWQEALEGALGRTPLTPRPRPLQLASGLKDGPQHAADFYGAIGGAERLFDAPVPGFFARVG